MLYAVKMGRVAGVVERVLWVLVPDTFSVVRVAVALALALRLLGLSDWIMWELAALFENIGTAHDGINSISLPPTVDDAPGAPALPPVRGDVRFKNVAFHYGKGSGVIEHLDLHVRPGEKIGMVGRSGAGKSTLANLLLRFHDVEAGRITVAGIDRKST